MTRCCLLNINKSVARYGAKKLKIRTLARKKMSKTMAEFAKHRGVEVDNLRFHFQVLFPMPISTPISTQGTGEEVDRETNAGQYGRKVVLVTDA